METRSEKRMKLMQSMNPNKDELPYEEDRISNLPDAILYHILRLLPIKSAAKTIILSHRWKPLFPSIPYLDFTTIDSSPLLPARVLSLRDKISPIITLKLNSIMSFMCFHDLIKYHRINDIQELYLNLKIQDYSDCPLNLINNESIRVLCLSFTYFNANSIPTQLQVMNKRFKWLHTMTISNLYFKFPEESDIFTDLSFPMLKKLILKSCNRMEKLNVRCSEMQDLVIKNCYDLNQLNIYGLKLERLEMDNCFNNSSINSKVQIIAPVIKYVKWVHIDITHTPVFEKSVLLEEVIIDFYIEQYNTEAIQPGKIRNFFNVFAALSNVKSLKFIFSAWQIFTANDFDSIVINKLESLRTLEICIELYHFSSYKNFSPVATILENSPYLHTLIITVAKPYEFGNWLLKQSDHSGDLSCDKYWEDQVPEMDSLLNHLKMVKFVGFLDCDRDVSLAKFLLKHGKVLENVILCLEPDNRQLQRDNRQLQRDNRQLQRNNRQLQRGNRQFQGEFQQGNRQLEQINRQLARQLERSSRQFALQLARRKRIMSMIFGFSWASSKACVIFQ